jgi:phospholipid-binding lipoprotein MlaA
VFALNDGLDQVVLKPVATGYEYVLPTPVRTGVSNFFGNVGDVFVGVNNVLQGKLADGFSDFGRVAINTTIGLLGVFDVATELGVEKHNEDFGQTLGHWGVDDGPYVVLPLFGPRTTRDTVGFVVDTAADPVARMDHDPSRVAMSALRLINQRADLLPADKMIDEAALDKYSYIRSAYLQRRRSLIYDGNPPRARDDD